MASTVKLTCLAIVILATAACGSDQDPPAVAAQPTSVASEPEPGAPPQWQHYGGSLAGDRFAGSVEISPANVASLRPAWQHQTGDVANGGDDFFGRKSSFKATPVYFRDKLIFSTGFNRVIALDPATGDELWAFDPDVDFSIEYSEMFTSRGIATWSAAEAPSDGRCQHRVFLGTLDARLIALDADTGARCRSFGRRGVVDLSRGIDNYRRGEYSVTSPPTVVNGVVIVGSSIGDNSAVSVGNGAVRAFDALTGKQRWRFDPVPTSDDAPGADDWRRRQAKRTGAGNVWSIMSADAKRDLVFLPTTSPSPDFYGGLREGENRYTNSVVALRASTGKFVWGYQIVHHDLWDLDLASQPLLIDLNIDGTTRPALAQATKMGFVFVLDRETGEPLHEVVETAVPASTIDGEQAAATQRFPKIRLHATDKDGYQLWNRDAAHTAKCQAMLKDVRYEGIFTPPSLQGTLLYPGNPGGVNWGSMAANPAQGVALVAVNRWPTVVKLIPRKEFKAARRSELFNGVDAQFTEQAGAPYAMARFDVYNRDTDLPCHKGPWSTLVAVELASGNILWETPVGRAPELSDDDPAAGWGYFVKGGPMITANGVGFLATPYDFTLRAHDLKTGATLWEGKLPAQPGSTPMAFRHNGSDYVVVTAGGQRRDDTGRGDYVIAYRLAI